MKKEGGCTVGGLVEETIANQIICLGQETLAKAKNVADRLEIKLATVLIVNLPESENEEKIAAVPQLPPLFDELRSIFWEIQYKLNKIEDLNNRTAL